MALSDYNNSAIYDFTSAKSMTSGDWSTPTIDTWAMFAGQLGITASNYSRYGLKTEYWSSSNNFLTLTGAYYVNFSTGKIDSTSNSAGLSVRLVRTF